MKEIEEQEDFAVESEDEAKERRNEAVVRFAATLLSKRDKAIEARVSSGVERRWREDQDAFEGIDDATRNLHSMINYATGDAFRGGRDEQPRSRVLVNIIRNKCETAWGRFCDIMLPVDGKNWELKPTPVPELSRQLEDKRPAMQGGQPVTDEQGNQASMAQIAADLMAQAKLAMDGMEAEIDDQLTECEYNAECRKAIYDAVLLGTGIIKGPSVVKRYNQQWRPVVGADDKGQQITVHELQMVEQHKPASKRVSPWNVYPSPYCGEDVRKASYFWERDTISPREVMRLIGLDGYMEDQLRQVLDEEPKRTIVAPDRGGKTSSVQQEEMRKGSLYEIWEYHGELSRDDIEALECECPGIEDMQQENVSVCVVFINDRPVKVALNVLDTGDMPYDFFQWGKVSESPWGIGIPRIMMWIQRIITAAWRAMMDNAGDCAGAMRIIKRRDVEPADGNWTLTRNKLFFYLGDDDARQAIAQFQLDSRQVELQQIIDLALRFADMETGVPALFQGEGRTAPETLGATNIMVDSNNVGLRMRVKCFDDQITVPHLTRYYHYNMMYSPKDEIKGDYQVDPRGVRVLMEQDQQGQAIVQLWPLLGDPEISGEVDKKKAARQLFGAYRLDIFKDKAKAEQQPQEGQPQQQPQDTSLQAAQVRAEAQLQVAQLNQQSDIEELKLKYRMAQEDREHERAMKEVELQIAMMKMSNDRNMSIDSIKAALASDTMKLQTQKELSVVKGPQVTTPPTEPAGRAPNGQAFPR